MTAQHGASRAPLLETKLNTVTASSALAFRVVVHNGGTSSDSNVEIVLTIARPRRQGGPMTYQVTVGSIPANKTRTVIFSKLGAIPFATSTSLTVSVPSVTQKLYPVIFALPR